MAETLVIQGGKAVLPTGIACVDIVLEHGIISKIYSDGCNPLPPNADIIDARGLFIVPGGIDPHVHISRKANKADDFYTGSLAALAGGTTTVIDFCEPDKGESALSCIADRKEKAHRAAVDYGFHFAFTENYRMELSALDAIVQEGITSFKAFTCYENTTLNRGDLLDIMEAICHIGPILIHAEANDICNKCAERLQQADPMDFYNHAIARPALAEWMSVQDVRELAKYTGAKACIAHTSTGKALEEAGGTLAIETCPHYLAFTAENMKGKNGCLYTMTPPLRVAQDREAMWRGLLGGSVNMISTDHCAFPQERKRTCRDWRLAPNGVGGIQQRMTYLFSEGVMKRGLSLRAFVDLTSANAAKYYGLWPKKGCIAPGSDGDLTLLDPTCQWKFSTKDIAGAEDHSLYDGMEFTGVVRKTILRGQVVYENGRTCIKPGDGKYLARPIH